LKLNIPKPLIGDISEDELKLYLGIMLYRERKLSVAKAAKLAMLTLPDFIYELGKHQQSFTNITLEELEEELKRIT
jgi:predicted HTH domain antitoxin